jgi:hypothetical protein
MKKPHDEFPCGGRRAHGLFLHRAGNAWRSKMLKRIVIVSALIATPAVAQQTPPDPALSTYSQLLVEANGRVVQLSVQDQRLQQQLADLQKQLADEKAKNAPKPAPNPAASP